MSQPGQEIKIKVLGFLGTKAPFDQGGVIRITFPKMAVKTYKLNEKVGKEPFEMMFVNTDRGILMIPFDKTKAENTVREALKFMDTSSLTKEDIDLLMGE